jgi:hypothetical protein
MISPPFPHKILSVFWLVGHEPPHVEYLVVNLVCEFWPRGVAAVIKILEKFLLLYNKETENSGDF